MNMREKMEAALLGSFKLEDWMYVEGKTGDNEIVVDGHIRLSKMVDAVLDAMLEPTEEVIEAGWGQALDDKPGPIWQAMIDAIKAGK